MSPIISGKHKLTRTYPPAKLIPGCHVVTAAGYGFLFYLLSGLPQKQSYDLNFWNSIKSSLEFCICGNIITHFSIIISSISKHIKISCSGKSKHNSLFFSSLFTFHCFIQSCPDRMSAFRRRKNSFHAGNI